MFAGPEVFAAATGIRARVPAQSVVTTPTHEQIVPIPTLQEVTLSTTAQHVALRSADQMLVVAPSD